MPTYSNFEQTSYTLYKNQSITSLNVSVTDSGIYFVLFANSYECIIQDQQFINKTDYCVRGISSDGKLTGIAVSSSTNYTLTVMRIY